MTKRFNPHEPKDAYKVVYETKDGEVHETGGMSYAETEQERHELESLPGVHVQGVSRRPGV